MSLATLDTVLPLVQQLSVREKIRLIEYLLPDIKHQLPSEPLRDNLLDSAMAASEPSFSRVWDNEEDAVYDHL